MPASDEAKLYLERIAGTLRDLFGVDRDEAIGRINRFWQASDFTQPGAVNALLHEMPDFWAKTIWYGRDAKWWLGEEGLEPEAYP